MDVPDPAWQASGLPPVPEAPVSLRTDPTAFLHFEVAWFTHTFIV